MTYAQIMFCMPTDKIQDIFRQILKDFEEFDWFRPINCTKNYSQIPIIEY